MSKKRKPPIRHRVLKTVAKVVPPLAPALEKILPPEPVEEHHAEPPTYHEPVIHRVSRSHVSMTKGIGLGFLALGVWLAVIYYPVKPIKPTPTAKPSPAPVVFPTMTPSPTPTQTATETPQMTPSATATPAHRRHACSHNGREIVVGNYRACMNLCDDWLPCNAAFPLEKR
jgi:hypothetical protein